MDEKETKLLADDPQPARYSLDDILEEARQLKKQRIGNDEISFQTNENSFSDFQTNYIDNIIDDNILAVDEILKNDSPVFLKKPDNFKKPDNAIDDERDHEPEEDLEPDEPDEKLEDKPEEKEEARASEPRDNDTKDWQNLVYLFPDRTGETIKQDEERDLKEKSDENSESGFKDTGPRRQEKDAGVLRVHIVDDNRAIKAESLPEPAPDPVKEPTLELRPIKEPALERRPIKDNAKPKKIYSLKRDVSKISVNNIFIPHDQVVEKPGLRKKKTLFEGTADLQSLPIIVPAEEDAPADHSREQGAAESGAQDQKKPQKTAKREDYPEEIEGQIKLSGYEEAEKTDEGAPEAESEDRKFYDDRRKKVKRFKIHGIKNPMESDPENVESAYLEYSRPKDAPVIKRELDKSYVKLVFKTAALLALGFYLIYLGLSTRISLIVPTAFNPSYNPQAYVWVNIALALIAVFVCRSTIFGGIASFFRRSPDSDFGVAALMIISLAHAALMAFNYDKIASGQVQLFLSIAVLGLMFNSIGKLAIISRTSSNFEFVADKTEKYSINSVKELDDIYSITKGSPNAGDELRFSSKAGFLTRFLELSYSDDLADRNSRRTSCFGLVASLGIGVAVMVFTQDIVTSMTVFTASFCMFSPFSSLIASNHILKVSAKRMKKKGIMISGYAAVDYSANVTGMVFEASELFPMDNCMIYGIKLFNGMRIDEAILDTASVICASGGPLASLFNMVIEGRKDILPPVEEYIYEDRTGVSAWIYGRKVLVGSREMMTNHGIEMPDPYMESKYTHKNRKLIYLAENGYLAAMFVVSYSPDEKTARQITQLQSNGIDIFVRTTDPNITEKYLSECFGGPENAYFIMTPYAGKIYREKYSRKKEKASAGIAHTGGTELTIRAVLESIVLRSKIYLSSAIQTIGAGLGFAALALLALTRLSVYAGIFEICLYQIIWLAMSVIIPSIRKTEEKHYL